MFNVNIDQSRADSIRERKTNKKAEIEKNKVNHFVRVQGQVIIKTRRRRRKVTLKRNGEIQFAKAPRANESTVK
jgi:hypothetical protein